ncbi:branched-chain amino acid aminotransferase [Streptomyces sp. NPDC005708]|uniref:branched-chain amino acid aminotransferase n=1 Tax=Streptomyces sp. NPDC005708 TaxID=3154564 RepID=UPI0033C5A1F4
MSIEPTLSLTPPERIAEIHAAPGFGRHFTDHMVTIQWTPDNGWHSARLGPYGPMSLDPATRAFHYGETVFEGFKAYMQPDGSVATFRPEVNATRFQRSAARLGLPQLPVEDFVAAADALVRQDAAWVPGGKGTSLYLRPFMMATEVGLGIAAVGRVTFFIIASPAGAYFRKGRVAIWLTETYSRAAPGGTGAAKCGGNYAGSLLAQKEAEAHGCDQVVFLDAIERRWIEELGGMNLWFVFADGTLATPSLTGTILEGVTRDAVKTLASDMGHTVKERPIEVDEWRDGIQAGRITEVFACGTAAVISSIGTLRWADGEVSTPGPALVADKIRDALLGVQQGRLPDAHRWLHAVT